MRLNFLKNRNQKKNKFKRKLIVGNWYGFKYDLFDYVRYMVNTYDLDTMAVLLPIYI